MKYLTLIILTLVVGMVSCKRSTDHKQILAEAERIAYTLPDSALALVNDIEPSDLKEDSLRALYHLVTASAHKAKESSMVSDSLIRFSFDYYRDRDNNRFLQSGDLYALYLFWVGDGKRALGLLDSIVALPDIPQRLMIQLLQSRIGIGGAEFDSKNNLRYIKRLLELDNDSANQIEYTYQLCENYQYAGHGDSALIIIDRLIDHARMNHLGNEHFKYTYEKVGILEEIGRYDESNAQVDYILQHAPHNSAIPYLHLWKALNYFNTGAFAKATHELAIADSCAKDRIDVDNNYYESFVGPLREFLEYRKNGRIKLIQLATLNNSQRDRFNRMESTRWETEQNALRQENRALTLKAQNERNTAILIIVLLASIIISLVAVWNIQKRKRKTIEAEERAETLQKMVDELSAPATPSNGHESLRRAMLQQLGIIKMVAETPTEQNREMLRKISSIGSDTNGALVNWKNVYEIIDNLYSGFYSLLHERYGNLLTEKEEQIIVLMIAGFSTKEISVITSQTTATIYVRKSSVRKKLGVPEKEDIVAFLRHEASV
ncbi:LuxR C-terminal-related transcriptional regulator [uncultured Duncaniella sp.]|jgi:DNA-binding CsgD family transcriptional regulator|uniref:LuxR C-terminal-related transcriptional regulator n=1 Tax=uncultured Duncaniella sp. TaxID=2768039 RepID=UPI0025AEF794|nr:LuxR C-terminal-related transcriptional regulator [uncultured Duncaniella sp.]